MNTFRVILILFVVMLFATPGWAQIDLPFEFYGEPFSGEGDFTHYLHPAISPDGNHFAATYYRFIEIGLYPELDMSSVLKLKDTLFGYDIAPYCFGLSFLPDNARLAYVIRIYDPDYGAIISHGDSLTTLQNGIPAIATVNLNTGEHELLIESGERPVWSPDGRFVAYVYSDYRKYTIEPSAAVYDTEWALYDFVTSESIFLKDILSVESFKLDEVTSLTFNADGTQILFTKQDNQDVLQVYTAPLDGSSATQMTAFQAAPGSEYIGATDYETGLFVSPDDEWLVLQVNISVPTYCGPNQYLDLPADSVIASDGVTPVPYLIMSELSSGKAFSLLTGEELSADLRELIDYRQHLIDEYNGAPIQAVFRTGDTVTGYKINNVSYDYYDFHLISPRFLDWSTDGRMILYGYEAGPSHVYVKSFDPELFKSSPTVVADAAPSAFPSIDNYPNPFNPATTLTFNLPEGGYTEVSVYNLAGQRIRELFAGHLAPGTHDVVWDGRDMNGMPVSSGVFFSRLRTGDTVVTDRMALVK